MNRADTIDWIIAAHDATVSRGLVFNQHMRDILATLSTMAGNAPFLGTDDPAPFEPFEGERKGILGRVIAEANPVSTVFFTRDNEVLSGLATWYVSAGFSYTPGASHARYAKELSAFLARLDVASRVQQAIAWVCLQVFVSGAANPYDEIAETLNWYLYEGRSQNRQSRDLADAVMVTVAETVTRVAADQSHPYLKTLTELVRAYRVRPAPPAHASLVFGL